MREVQSASIDPGGLSGPTCQASRVRSLGVSGFGAGGPPEGRVCPEGGGLRACGPGEERQERKLLPGWSGGGVGKDENASF